MYHLYEKTDTASGRFLVFSEDQWSQLSSDQRAAYRLCSGGFSTGLEAVLGLVRLSRIGLFDAKSAVGASDPRVSKATVESGVSAR